MQAETWMNLQSEKVNLEGWIPGNYINICLLQEDFRNGGQVAKVQGQEGEGWSELAGRGYEEQEKRSF